jgi:hypothetical protein
VISKFLCNCLNMHERLKCHPYSGWYMHQEMSL